MCGAWCSDPGTSVQFGFSSVLGFGHSCSACLYSVVSAQDELSLVLVRSVLSRERAVSSSLKPSACVVSRVARGSCLRRPCAFMSCFVLCCAAHSLCFSLAVCFHVVMFCVNTWLVIRFTGHVLVLFVMFGVSTCFLVSCALL